MPKFSPKVWIPITLLVMVGAFVIRIGFKKVRSAAQTISSRQAETESHVKGIYRLLSEFQKLQDGLLARRRTYDKLVARLSEITGSTSSDFDFLTYPPLRRASPINLLHDILDAQNGKGTLAILKATANLESRLDERTLTHTRDLPITEVRIDDHPSRLLWRPPQHITAYSDKFIYTNGEDIRIWFAGGLLSKGAALTGYEIFDAITDNSILDKSLPPASFKIVRQGCHSSHNGGARYPGRLVIPGSALKIGEYYLILKDDIGASSNRIYFNTRPHVRDGSDAAEVVVMFPNLTWHAYNLEGGGSLYYKTHPTRSAYRAQVVENGLYAVSLNRPVFFFPEQFHKKLYIDTCKASLVFVRALREAGIPYRTTSNTDLHRNADVLIGARLIVFTGHDEYWTEKMRESVDSFIKTGGHVANFSGNISWMKAKLVGDELYLARRGTTGAPIEFSGTGLWNSKKADYPTEKTFGLSYAYAGYPLQEALSREEALSNKIDGKVYDASNNIVIKAPDHPVFRNTNLKRNDQWGGNSGILYSELDGVPLDEEGSLHKDFADRFPRDLRVLATTVSFNGNGMTVKGRRYYGFSRIGIMVECQPFERGGTVLSFGSIGYFLGLLRKDPIAHRIFINSVLHLLAQKAGS